MRIHLQELAPDYLGDAVTASSQVWRESLSWDPGTRVGIQGPSGRGKSSLIRILCGLERHYRGSLCYGDREMRPDRVAPWPEIRRTGVAALLQQFHLMPDDTGRENLLLVPLRAEDATDQAVAAWAERLEIHDLLGRPVRTWSQGQQQRLALLRALISPVHWLLLDEPFSHLDSRTREAAVALICELADQRGTGWVITHLEAEPELPCTVRLQV